MVSSIIGEPAPQERRSRSQCLVAQRGVSIQFFALDIRRLGRTQHAQRARTFSITRQVGLMFQFKGYVLVADGADQEAVGGVAQWSEDVVAHHARATHGDPKIWSLRRAQGSPPKTEFGGIIHRKRARLSRAPETGPGPRWVTRGIPRPSLFSRSAPKGIRLRGTVYRG